MPESEEECWAVVLFHAIHPVFRLERALRGAGIACRAIPTPRQLSSDCGTALRFPLAQRAEVEATVRTLAIDIAGIDIL